MRYRYLDDFRRGISVFAIFSRGISVLGTSPMFPSYLVSTRREMLSNVDRNAKPIVTGTRLRHRKNLNKINPARVRIPSQLLF